MAIFAVCARATKDRHYPGEFSNVETEQKEGFRDFQNAIYFPVRAFLTGVNPYSADYVDYHPDGRGFPLFAPTSLVIHAPFGFLQLRVAEAVYVGVNIALLLLVCVLIFRYSESFWSIGGLTFLAFLMIFCRPGLLNFYGMQLTILHIFGCLLALQYADERPMISGFGLFLASCKPTYCVPLAILMLFRGDLRAVVWGTLVSVIVSCCAVGWIASNCGGWEVFIEQLSAQYFSSEQHPDVPLVATSWTRIDLYSVIPRWTDVPSEWHLNWFVPIATIVFGALCVLLERNPLQRRGAMSRTGIFAMLIVLISVYHQAYDAMLLWVVIAAIALNAPKIETAFSSTFQMLLAILLLIPMYNFFGTRMLIDRMDLQPEDLKWKIVVTVNAVAIAVAALLVGLRMLGSSFSQVDRLERELSG